MGEKQREQTRFQLKTKKTKKNCEPQRHIEDVRSTASRSYESGKKKRKTDTRYDRRNKKKRNEKETQ